MWVATPPTTGRLRRDAQGAPRRVSPTTTKGSNEDSSDSLGVMHQSMTRWLDVARAAVPIAIGIMIIWLFVFPTYEKASQPTPVPYANSGFVSLVVDGQITDAVTFTMRVESPVEVGGNRPSDKRPPLLTFDVGLRETTQESARATLLVAGDFGAAVGVCDQGNLREARFEDLSPLERETAVNYLKKATSANVTADPLEVARIASNTPYRLLAFEMETNSDKRVSCDLELDELMEVDHTSRLFSVPSLVMASRYEEVVSDGSPTEWTPAKFTISRNITIYPQVETSFKESYPAPGNRTAEEINWSESDSGADDYLNENKAKYIEMGAVSGRFGDETGEAGQRMAVFWAGVWLGLAGSMIAAGFIVILELVISKLRSGN